MLVAALGVLIGIVVPPDDSDQPAAETVREAPPANRRPAANAVDTVLDRKADGHFYVDAMVNGRRVHFLVDTGASNVILTSADARHVGLSFSPGEFEVIGRGASGDVRGKRVTLDRIAIGPKEASSVRAAIADEGLDISLLGQSFLSRIGSVTISDDRMTLR